MNSPAQVMMSFLHVDIVLASPPVVVWTPDFMRILQKVEHIDEYEDAEEKEQFRKKPG